MRSYYAEKRKQALVQYWFSRIGYSEIADEWPAVEQNAKTRVTLLVQWYCKDRSRTTKAGKPLPPANNPTTPSDPTNYLTNGKDRNINKITDDFNSPSSETSIDRHTAPYTSTHASTSMPVFLSSILALALPCSSPLFHAGYPIPSVK